MPQCVQRDTFELGAPGDALPGLRQALMGQANVASRKYRVALGMARQLREQIGSSLTQRSQAKPLFRVGKAQLPRLEVDFRLGQEDQLAAPTAGQCQQANGVDGVQVLAQGAVIVNREEGLAAFVARPLDAVHGVVSAKALADRETEYPAQ
jgi:hypothetical protein